MKILKTKVVAKKDVNVTLDRRSVPLKAGEVYELPFDLAHDLIRAGYVEKYGKAKKVPTSE